MADKAKCVLSLQDSHLLPQITDPRHIFWREWRIFCHGWQPPRQILVNQAIRLRSASESILYKIVIHIFLSPFSQKLTPIEGRSALLGEHKLSRFMDVACGSGAAQSYTFCITATGWSFKAVGISQSDAIHRHSCALQWPACIGQIYRSTSFARHITRC